MSPVQLLQALGMKYLQEYGPLVITREEVLHLNKQLLNVSTQGRYDGNEWVIELPKRTTSERYEPLDDHH